ncbi:hypothetical protein K503DRAFT_768638 [Rhizopogon vinicolor AM-OR11-026]|uniref:Uncharacterized protein n=1 Tax=Rhizopogon vinicolor AM-OR11-026 TaxID=1314800 RepID=A0A1B7N697_9AGAM|nr:hypothetical protein K503DRAFT_768638 [Rhizopogon vinicolor AM-OR11-026]
MDGLCSIIEKAYNHLIMNGLPHDAPAVVDDFKKLQARPKRSQHGQKQLFCFARC